MPELIHEFRDEVDVIGYPKLVRLNPNIPWKTRGNGAVCIQIVDKPELDPETVLECAASLIEKLAQLDETNTNPGIVVIKTELSQDVAKVLLANSITLTPGTFTLDIIGDTLLVHWIDVKSEDTAEATRLIAGRFEKHLKAVFA